MIFDIKIKSLILDDDKIYIQWLIDILTVVKMQMTLNFVALYRTAYDFLYIILSILSYC